MPPLWVVAETWVKSGEELSLLFTSPNALFIGRCEGWVKSEEYFMTPLFIKFSESRIINQDKKGHKDYMNIGNNIGNIMKITGAWNTFKSNHPKFPAFCQAVSRKGLKEGSIIEIVITTPEGEKIETNLKVKDSDLELLKQLSELKM